MERLMKVANQVPTLLLRSPLHAVLSKRLMLLTFTGRRSGRRYTTPVVYVRHGGDLVLTTDSSWWRNLRGGAPVTMRIGGRTVQGIGHAEAEPAASVAVLRHILAEHPAYARRVRIPTGPDGAVDVDAAVRAGRVGVRITPNEEI